MNEPGPGQDIPQGALPPVVQPPIAQSVVVEPASPPGPWRFWATMGWTALIAFGFFIAQIAGGVLFVIFQLTAGHKIPPIEDLQYNGLLLSFCTLLSTPAAVGLSVLFAWLRHGVPVREYLALKRPTLRQIIAWTALLIAFVIVGDVTTNLARRDVVPSFMVEAWHTAFVPLLCFVVIVLAPIAEEFVFRGFMFTGLWRSRVGATGAVLLTSLTWASIHLQYGPIEIAYIFFGGILLGVARIKTGSLLLCIFLHALMNLISTGELILYLLSQK